MTAPATPSLHAELHNVVSYVTLALTVTELVILALRFRREPSWRRCALPVALAAIAMMAFLAAFGVLIANHGTGGIFEKLASVTPTVVSTLIVIRLIVRRDARLGPKP